jgi:hypothetical protein
VVNGAAGERVRAILASVDDAVVVLDSDPRSAT